MKLHLIAGARPNFMKIAPLWHVLRSEPDIVPVFVHMGQHRDDAMSAAILRDVKLPEPDHYLDWSQSGGLDPVAAMMAAYERLCMADRPDAVLVVGDVNASLAAAMIAHEMSIPLVHLEAGLRSFDPAMVEERNRIAIDQKADFLLTPSPEADENLLHEGIAPHRIRRVGNIMIDCYEMLRDEIAAARSAEKLGLENRSYGIVTLHRPENVDDPARLSRIVDGLLSMARKDKLCFPLHPRTAGRLREIGRLDEMAAIGITMIDPLPYIAFMSLVAKGAFVLTDSGGIQEETSYLGIDCFTLRNGTERPVTVSHGSNRLIRLDMLPDVIRNRKPRGKRPIPLWDGQTAQRVVQVIKTLQ